MNPNDLNLMQFINRLQHHALLADQGNTSNQEIILTTAEAYGISEDFWFVSSHADIVNVVTAVHKKQTYWIDDLWQSIPTELNGLYRRFYRNQICGILTIEEIMQQDVFHICLAVIDTVSIPEKPTCNTKQYFYATPFIDQLEAMDASKRIISFPTNELTHGFMSLFKPWNPR